MAKHGKLLNVGVGTPSGPIMNDKEYYKQLKAHGYEIIRTPNGTIINPPKK